MNEPNAPLPSEPSPLQQPNPTTHGGQSEWLVHEVVGDVVVEAACAAAHVASGAAEVAGAAADATGSALGCLGSGCLGCFSTSVLLLVLLFAASAALAFAP